MIHYQKGFGGLFIVLQVAGTSWPYGILPGLLSAALGYVLGELEDLDSVVRDKTEFIDNPYPFQLFAYLVGFVIVFRTNFAYQRYWEGIDAVQRMGAKWLDGACMAIAFDAPGDVSQPFLAASIKPTTTTEISRRTSATSGTSSGAPCAPSVDAEPKEGDVIPVGSKESNFIPMDSTVLDDESHAAETPEMISHRDFFAEMCHLFSLLHALSLQHLRCDCDLDNLVEATTGQDQLRMTMLGEAPPTSMEVISERGCRGVASVLLGHFQSDWSRCISCLSSRCWAEWLLRNDWLWRRTAMGRQSTLWPASPW